MNSTDTDILLYKAAIELENLKQSEEKRDTSSLCHYDQRFPLHCLKLLYNIPGNMTCMDCNASNPQWASLTFGTLVCIVCSGHHRHMGVQISKVRSITMDSWQYSDVLRMLEGGNQQLGNFFSRHFLTNTHSNKYYDSNNNNNVVLYNRYKTNAAKFYKEQLQLHILRVVANGLYKGRQCNRNLTRTLKKKQSVNDAVRNNLGKKRKKRVELVGRTQQQYSSQRMSGIVACCK